LGNFGQRLYGEFFNEFPEFLSTPDLEGGNRLLTFWFKPDQHLWLIYVDDACSNLLSLGMLYSCELICGVITGVSRGGTGQMSVLGRVGKRGDSLWWKFQGGR
jgi:hypothetical protein